MNGELDTRFLAFLVWGVGTVLVYGVVVARRVVAHWLHHDARSRRDLLSGVALFVVALFSGLSVALVLFGEQGSGLRGLLVAGSLGAYTAAGIVMATERPREGSQ